MTGNGEFGHCFVNMEGEVSETVVLRRNTYSIPMRLRVGHHSESEEVGRGKQT